MNYRFKCLKPVHVHSFWTFFKFVLSVSWDKQLKCIGIFFSTKRSDTCVEHWLLSDSLCKQKSYWVVTNNGKMVCKCKLIFPTDSLQQKIEITDLKPFLAGKNTSVLIILATTVYIYIFCFYFLTSQYIHTDSVRIACVHLQLRNFVPHRIKFKPGLMGILWECISIAQTNLLNIFQRLCAMNPNFGKSNKLKT